LGAFFLQLMAFFFKLGAKNYFWDRENQLFWELYGPLGLKQTGVLSIVI